MSAAIHSTQPEEGLAERINRLCTLAATLGPGPIASEAEAIRSRFNEPLRVAIAGRIKAGKSTLLNAIVGERLAATDAGECTRIPTWYRRGSAYAVRARLRSGREEELRFSRTGGALTIHLAPRQPGEIASIHVEWPAARLGRLTLIDTPGLESLDEERSQRTRVLLGLEPESQSQADAVIYLMRHMHRTDADFLEAFLDRSLGRPSPVNAVAVLSRADEVGAERLDAMDSAAAIAQRYAADRRVRSFCTAVLPVAGLLAETAGTLREEEVGRLRDLAGMPGHELDAMLLSVDRFMAPGVSPLSGELRRDLLLRLGLFGVRFALAQLHADPALTATGLSRHLRRASGIDELVDAVDAQLGGRSTVLKARSAALALMDLAEVVARQDPEAGRRLRVDVERLQAGAHEFEELRLVHLVLTGQVELRDDERAEVMRLVGDGEPAVKLGLTPEAPGDQQRAAALERLERWRRRAAHPMADRALVDAGEIIAHSYERLYGSTL